MVIYIEDGHLHAARTPLPAPIPNVQSVFVRLSQLHFSGGSIEYTASDLDDFVAEMEAKV